MKRQAMVRVEMVRRNPFLRNSLTPLPPSPKESSPGENTATRGVAPPQGGEGMLTDGTARADGRQRREGNLSPNRDIVPILEIYLGDYDPKAESLFTFARDRPDSNLPGHVPHWLESCRPSGSVILYEQGVWARGSAANNRPARFWQRPRYASKRRRKAKCGTSNKAIAFSCLRGLL